MATDPSQEPPVPEWIKDAASRPEDLKLLEQAARGRYPIFPNVRAAAIVMLNETIRDTTLKRRDRISAARVLAVYDRMNMVEEDRDDPRRLPVQKPIEPKTLTPEERKEHIEFLLAEAKAVLDAQP